MGVNKKVSLSNHLKRMGFVALFGSIMAAKAFAAEAMEYPVYPTVIAPDAVQAKKIQLGEYLVKASDCIACHTKPGGKPFAGGLPVVTPFGTIYSPNITPDKDTGIGNWTEEDFLRAMKHGIAPDGSYYFPVFPYTSFTKMTDEDVLAIKAYLDVVPAVVQANLDPDMPIPFRWRFGQLFWRTLFFRKGDFQPDPNHSREWNRGAYLVQGPGHCGMCHSPLNFLGAPKMKYDLGGGVIEGYIAPAINAKALAQVETKEIVDVFLHNHRIGGGTLAAKPMLEVNKDSLSLLSQDDLFSIATYLKTVKSETAPVEKVTGSASEVGKKIYEKYCQACHASGAGGAPKLGDAAAWAPRLASGKEKVYNLAIKGFGSMPAKGTCITCSDEDIQNAVDYMIGDAASGEGKPAKPVVELPKATLELGKQVYDKVCAVCHDAGKLGSPKLGDQTAWAPLIDQNFDVLVSHSIKGYRGMPARGACYDCSDTDIIAAVKYMVQQGKSSGDYLLW